MRSVSLRAVSSEPAKVAAFSSERLSLLLPAQRPAKQLQRLFTAGRVELTVPFDGLDSARQRLVAESLGLGSRWPQGSLSTQGLVPGLSISPGSPFFGPAPICSSALSSMRLSSGQSLRVAKA